MLGNSLASIILDLLILLFGASALCHLFGLDAVTWSNDRPTFPHHFYRVAGTVELLTALFLVLPQTRVWGVALGYMVTISAVVMLLNRSRYAWSAAHIAVLVALGPAALVAV